MALHQCQSKTGLEALMCRKFQNWVDYSSINPSKKFPGVKLCDIWYLENCFQVNINAIELLANLKVIVHCKSQNFFADTVYLDMHGNQLSYVKDIDNYVPVVIGFSSNIFIRTTLQCLFQSDQIQISRRLSQDLSNSF